jgi:hypothetical protein
VVVKTSLWIYQIIETETHRVRMNKKERCRVTKDEDKKQGS